jgi:hypothetical protein
MKQIFDLKIKICKKIEIQKTYVISLQIRFTIAVCPNMVKFKFFIQSSMLPLTPVTLFIIRTENER